VKASILIFSQTGNTLKVGAYISKGLQICGVEVDQVSFLHRKRWKPVDADLIGIGCPVFENRPAEVVPKYLADSGFDLTGKKAFVFITSGGSPAKSLWHLSQAVTKTGASVLGGIQLRGCSSFPTLFGLFSRRPNEMDLERAEKFGHAVAANIMNGESLASHYKIESNQGGIFYDKVGPIINFIKKKTTPLPVSDSEKCNLCGNCIYECPTGSITVENKTIKFHSTCIVCYRCWHVCPQTAITIKFSPGDGLIERIIYSEKMERFFSDVKPDEYVGPNLYKDVLAHNLRLKYDRKNPTAEYDYIKRK
jgi:ferredoxin/flavodoxin